jgi:hypothetical protein
VNLTLSYGARATLYFPRKRGAPFSERMQDVHGQCSRQISCRGAPLDPVSGASSDIAHKTSLSPPLPMSGAKSLDKRSNSSGKERNACGATMGFEPRGCHLLTPLSIFFRYLFRNVCNPFNGTDSSNGAAIFTQSAFHLFLCSLCPKNVSSSH